MIAQVILSTIHAEIDRIFDYEIPFTLIDKVSLGMRVKVPFGAKNSRIEGYVVGIKENADIPMGKVKYIAEVMDEFPVFSAKDISLAYWMREKYYTTLTQCLQTIMPQGMNLKNSEKLLFLNKKGDELEEIKKKMRLKEKSTMQLLAIEFIELYGENTASYIQKALKISPSPLNTLIKHEILGQRVAKKRKELNYSNYEKKTALNLTEEQLNAFNTVMDKGEPVLIHGVTGSGKTEIYLQAIEKIIAEGKQAIVLVPEISLTPQLFQRFFSRFEDKVALSHSRMSAGERHEVWQRAKNKEISVVIGARSAIFMPFDNLGIIVIDEEHENTYKSDTTPKYDAREVAEYKAKQHEAIMIYGSATPSLKTYYRGEMGEIRIVKLNKRAKGQDMPEVKVVDMREELVRGNRTIFSDALCEAIQKRLQAKEQVMLFINRRGFSTFVSCRKCGEVITCDRCNVSYTYHSSDSNLMCHYCGSKREMPTVCPTCSSKYIKFFGAGTQKVEEETRKMFPNAKVLRMDMDTTTKKQGHKNILDSFGRGDADILIGTQMIAKGHDFPNVTLVGIIAADLSLNMGDYRCGENTYQLITQVSGRAGRDKKKGEVVIQTYAPENYIIQLAANGNYDEFYLKEIQERKLMKYPPFENLFTVLIMGKNERDVIEQINCLKDIMVKNNTNFSILGPTPAVISKIKDEYRWRIFVKGEDEDELRSFVIKTIETLKKDHKKRNILINITMNPQSIV